MSISPQLDLHVQRYLRSGKTPEDLKEDLGINFKRHPSLPLILFKYSQIDSPRHHELVRECRGIVLEEGTWKIVAKGFNRFFNVGEVDWEYRRFNWDDFEVRSKEDGSLILLYNYEGEWHVNTSGSFGLGELDSYGGTWRDLFWATAPFHVNDLKMFNPTQTLVFELCTPYNKVVRTYKPTVYLLGIFDHVWQNEGYPSMELSPHLVDDLAEGLGVPRPKSYKFSGQEEVRKFLQDQEDSDNRPG
jgi:tRNA splicing ligase